MKQRAARFFDAIAGDESERSLQSRRFTQMAIIAAVPLLIVLALFAMERDWRTAGLLAAALALVLFCVWLDRRSGTASANLVFIWMLAVILTSIIWVNQGPYDEALMAYPTLVVAAAMLFTGKQFLGLFAFLLTALVSLNIASMVGWANFSAGIPGPSRPIDMLSILIASAAAGWVLANDMRQVIRRLRVEIARVRDSEANFANLALHDGLTQLPNRALARQRMDAAIVQGREQGAMVVVLFIDVDDFKTINDSLGHSVGDEFLQHVAKRLGAAVRDGDTVSRQGGDEFLVVLPDIRDLNAVSAIANQILQSISLPIEVRGMQLLTSASIGIAVFPHDGSEYESVLKCADLALYQAKDAGRNTFRFFDTTMNANLLEHVQLISGLRHGLHRHELVLHYQPIFDLASRRLVAVEALLRWQHPDLGLVLPGRFIAAAEKSGIIVDIGAWVLHEACRQMAAWRALGHSGFVVCVNLSMTQFKRGSISHVVQSALSRADLDPASLELELTESVLLQDSQKFKDELAGLKDLGVSLSIDDFGTGYSNLSYLQKLRVDKLKIDQTFVQRLLASSADKAIVAAIIQMARSLQLETVAEGIESEGECLLLAELGCDCGQGYWFGRPQAAEHFEALVQLRQ